LNQVSSCRNRLILNNLMISFENFKLSNGLEVVVHSDRSTSVVCLNILYKVGSRNEDPDKTGFAHLFEHLMFGGSKNIPAFDEPLQAVGGDNNAFTSTDITNYYTTVPSNNVETAFWLESDRMLSLSYDQKVLDVQKNVVVEEFKQRYLNQPYGDAWHLISPVAYESHAYMWPTIGKEINHVEKITMDDVRDFAKRSYHPSNAILVIAGDITVSKAKALCEKWFGSVAASDQKQREPIMEAPQNGRKFIEQEAKVPANMIYKCYHMEGRRDPKYYATDLLSDLMGRGKSSLLHQKLVKDSSLFTSINAYVTGTVDPGLFVISGQLSPDQSLEKVDAAIDTLLKQIDQKMISEALPKVKNLALSSLVFGEAELLNRAMNLAYSTLLGNTDLVNQETEAMSHVKEEDMLMQLHHTLREENETTLYYKSSQ
jgi:zinc protease